QIERLEETGSEMTGLSTGFRDLDKRLAGLQPANLVVIAARPAMGKSALTANIATNAALQGSPVAIFSLEMSKEEIVQRILASVGRVDSMKLRSGQLGPLWQKVIEAASKLYKAPIFIDDSPVVTVTDIRAKTRRLKRRSGLGLVVVDYLQLMEASGRENRQQEIAEISRNLKNLARELEVPILAVSQLNRSLESREDKRPRLSDLRESGCLTAETRLIRADTNAEVTLGELVTAGKRDVPVWTLDERFRLVKGNLSRAFPSGVKPVFEMRLASGHVIRASANHPFLTLDGWTPLEDLSPGSRIAVARNVPVPKEPAALDEDRLNSGSESIPVEIWDYVKNKAAPAAGVEIDGLTSGLKIEVSLLEGPGLSRERLMGVADALDDRYLKDLSTSDVLWDRVVEIKPVGEREVFDATVEGTHNFLANGIIAHNSIEQDADVVMFIYRHEYYHPEDAEARGLAEVVVAKHRAGSVGTVKMTFLPEFTRFADMGRDVS
ncbi:MAG: replicative DNA helicase, partial [Actinobacteria bacterium]|nr:replicative DNA helicase [Actinomycetota bacterium]